MKRLLTRSLLAIALAVAWLPAALAATLLPNGEQQFFDDNGDPLAFGHVYFYIPSTSTAKSTWQDSSQSTLNTNPVDLDLAGRAIIYGTGTYRQVLKSAAGTTIWDQLTADTSSGAPTFGGTSGGSGNAQTFTAGSFSSIDGQVVIFRAGFSNTAAMTLTPSGASAIAVVKDTVTGPVATAGGEVIANDIVVVIYDATAGTFHLVNSQVFAGAVLTTGAISAGGTLSYAGQITPTALSGNTNDWNPTGLSTTIVVRASASAAFNLTGITAPTINTTGRFLVIENVGSFNITLTAQDASSAAANRFAIAQAITLAPNQSAGFTYDTTTSNWRASGANQVADYQVFTATGANTWTKPNGFSSTAMVTALCWAGGGGGSNNAQGGGGGGGAAGMYFSTLGSLPSTVTVTIGTGGAVNSSGGSTTFGTIYTVFGGGGGTNGNTNGGGGGGSKSVGSGAVSTSNGGNILGGAGGAPGGDSTYGGGGGGNANGASGGVSYWGGGGGSAGNSAGATPGDGGGSFYGGGGGSGLGNAGATGAAGASVVGGSGGAANVAGSAPGGGGGRNAVGGRGECRVWTTPG